MNRTHRPSRTRRAALLIGMLLHLVGAAAIPFHVWGPEGLAAGGATVAERQDDGSSLPPHDELHCVVCQAATTMAEPAPGTVILVAESEPRAETPASRHALPSRPSAPARARAPPHA
ncbi:MAG TPA: hypothetical protein VHG08_00650 [Longimicrobium sp.]|nr:hypothetical protein [Longimicrobium sp.]